MNKNFSTLMAGLLLAGSFPVAAQYAHETDGEIPYRSQFVKSASLDAGDSLPFAVREECFVGCRYLRSEKHGKR